MAQLTTRVILELLIGIWIVVSLVVVVTDLAPVDPARALLGPAATQKDVKALRIEWGLERPFLERYFTRMAAVLQGDFGISYEYRQPAREMLMNLAPRTFGRALMGVLTGLAVALLFSRFVAPARSASAAFALLESIPSFCLLVLFLWGAAQFLHVTPLGGRAVYEILAVLAAAAYPAGAVATYMIDRVRVDGPTPPFVDFLRMLKAPEDAVSRVAWLSALPAGLLIGINTVGVAVTASAFSEVIFGLPGFGRIFFRACSRGDLPLVVAGTVAFALLLLIIQRVGDAVLRAIDPRLAARSLS